MSQNPNSHPSLLQLVEKLIPIKKSTSKITFPGVFSLNPYYMPKPCYFVEENAHVGALAQETGIGFEFHIVSLA
jgi:hypothetical protein